MNDIAKNSTKERLERAIEKENLLAQDVAAIFGMAPSYISWIKNPKYWDKVGDHFWDKVLAWVNSGQSLKEYSQKHGKELPPEKSVKLKITTAGELNPEAFPIQLREESANFKPVDFTPELKDKIETAERLSKHPYFSGVEEQVQKIRIDIEINLVINGQKIKLA